MGRIIPYIMENMFEITHQYIVIINLLKSDLSLQNLGHLEKKTWVMATPILKCVSLKIGYPQFQWLIITAP